MTTETTYLEKYKTSLGDTLLIMSDWRERAEKCAAAQRFGESPPILAEDFVRVFVLRASFQAIEPDPLDIDEDNGDDDEDVRERAENWERLLCELALQFRVVRVLFERGVIGFLPISLDKQTIRGLSLREDFRLKAPDGTLHKLDEVPAAAASDVSGVRDDLPLWAAASATSCMEA